MLNEKFWNKYFKVYDVLNLVIPYQELLGEIVNKMDIQKGWVDTGYDLTDLGIDVERLILLSNCDKKSIGTLLLFDNQKRKEIKAMMISRKFQRTKEDFTCERCGFFVRGSGYTNHCPQCLWSKHVDMNPGDRQATCQGFMEPVGVELKGGEYVILHRCVSCGFEKRNKAAKDDNFDAILKLPNHPIKR